MATKAEKAQAAADKRRIKSLEKQLERAAKDLGLAEETSSLFRESSNLTVTLEDALAKSRAGKGTLPSVSLIETQIAEIAKTNPLEAQALQDSLNTQRTVLQDKSEEQLLKSLRSKNIPATTETRTAFREAVATSGKELGPSSPEFKKSFDLAKFQSELQDAGFSAETKFSSPGQSASIGGAKKKGLLSLLGREAKAQPLLERALLLAEEGGGGKGVASLLGKAGKAVSGSRLGIGGAIGGGLLGLILMNLFGGDDEQEIPPAVQMQMLQQMAQLQMQQDLAQSLIGARGASAEKNFAQAQMLNLQALGNQPQAVLS